MKTKTVIKSLSVIAGVGAAATAAATGIAIELGKRRRGEHNLIDTGLERGRVLLKEATAEAKEGLETAERYLHEGAKELRHEIEHGSKFLHELKVSLEKEYKAAVAAQKAKVPPRKESAPPAPQTQSEPAPRHSLLSLDEMHSFEDLSRQNGTSVPDGSDILRLLILQALIARGEVIRLRSNDDNTWISIAGGSYGQPVEKQMDFSFRKTGKFLEQLCGSNGGFTLQVRDSDGETSRGNVAVKTSNQNGMWTATLLIGKMQRVA